MNRLRRLTLRILIITLIFLASVETGLRLLDPLGIRLYVAQVNTMADYIVPLPDGGYAYPIGALAAPGYSAHITPINTRAVPYSNPLAACILATIGDSVTFGTGVQDSETFTAQLALLFPDVRFLNTGKPGYNVAEVAQLIDRYPANGYVYLQINNDLQPITDWQQYTGFRHNGLAIADYWQIGRALSSNRFAETMMADAALRPVLNRLVQRADVITFGFDNALARETENLIVLPEYEHLSAIDPHPSATGHEQIANAMYPYLIEFVEGVCE